MEAEHSEVDRQADRWPQPADFPPVEAVALLRDGDKLTIDAVSGTIDVALSDAELAERRRAWTPRKNGYQSGTLWKYAQTVGDAENGAVTHPGGQAETHIYADL